MEEKTQDHPTAAKNNRSIEAAAAAAAAHRVDQPVESIIRDSRRQHESPAAPPDVSVQCQLCAELQVD